ncbi:hypothetical protein [Methylibium sp. Root1272]|uniref:hypothetical protein n=1 Tax=Methylibium sp. Root1272 TaxID=1736441 RepID=UPI0006F2A115|nr:hypothetical protein [Methylibium sp. Root1272]KQW76583.1 hypothetical protein ASC67_02720 [Methylibium sp. Root1272]
MLTRLPRQLPAFPDLLADLGNPGAALLARALGVTDRTVRRWLVDGNAPRPVLLALFWMTRWGQSEVACEAHNSAVMHAGMVGCLQREIAALRRELGRVLALGEFGAANSPSAVHVEHQPDDEPQHDGRRDGGREIGPARGVPVSVGKVVQLFPRPHRHDDAERGRA